MLGFPALDCLPSGTGSTVKGGAGAFRNEPKRISASFVWPSRVNVCSHLALMHGVQLQQQCSEGETMKRWTQIALIGVVVLAVASLAAAQGTLQVPSGTPQPTMRFGNFIEVGNDVLMHTIATTDFRYGTTTNFDFEKNVRDR